MTTPHIANREQRIAAVIRDAMTSAGRARVDRELARLREERKDVLEKHDALLAEVHAQIEKFKEVGAVRLAQIDADIEVIELGLAGSGGFAA